MQAFRMFKQFAWPRARRSSGSKRSPGKTPESRANRELRFHVFRRTPTTLSRSRLQRRSSLISSKPVSGQLPVSRPLWHNCAGCVGPQILRPVYTQERRRRSTQISRTPHKKSSLAASSILGMETNITRRDFLGSALLASGSALLGGIAPAELLAQNDDFTGYGGVGDYSTANGNTLDVLQAA